MIHLGDSPRQRKAIFFAAALVLLFGCASRDTDTRLAAGDSRLPTDAEVEQYNALVPPAERIICREETPIGTNIPRRVCRYIRDIEDTSTFHREQLRRVLR